MARQRLQVDSGLSPQPLRPAARPVDTFTEPAAGQQAAQLARGLSQLAPSLSRFGDVMFGVQADEQTAAGQKAAREAKEQMDANQQTYNDAVSKGLIDEHQNPFFIAAFKKQMGQAAAGDYANKLRVAMSADPGLQSSTDVGDFNKFESQFRQQWMAQNVGGNRDAFFEKGFGHLADAYSQDVAREFTSQVAARVKDQAGAVLYKNFSNILDLHFGKDDPAQVVAAINAASADFLANNPKGGRIANLTAIQSLKDYAVLHATDGLGDKALELMKDIDAGPGSKLFGTMEARQATVDAQQEMFQRRQMDYAASQHEAELQKQQTEHTIFSGLSDDLAKSDNPMGVDIRKYTELAKGDPQMLETIFRVQKAFADRSFMGDEQVYSDALMTVYGVNPAKPGRFLSLKDAAGLFADRQVSPQQYTHLQQEILERDRRNEDTGGQAGKVLRDPLFNLYKDTLEKRFIDQYGANTDEVKQRVADALGTFVKDFVSGQSQYQAMDLAGKTKYMQGLADHAFALHANSSMLDAKAQVVKDTQDRKGVISDPKTMRVMDDVDLNQLEAEFTDQSKPVAKRKLKGYSPRVLLMLRDHNIPPDPAAIHDFISLQRAHLQP